MLPDSQQFLARLALCESVQHWWLAFSGGLDSRVLLDLAVASGLAEQHKLSVVHINHGLQQDSAHWAQWCESICQSYGIPCHIHQVKVIDGASLEAQARDARYQVFEQLVESGQGLLLAHHADDQAETLLLRLLRGSGVKGLASIPQQRPLGKGVLLRPLLDCSRQLLEAYAREHQLQWIEDPSNRSLVHDRNYIRHEVLPRLSQRWPQAAKAMATSAQFAAESQKLNEQLAEIDLQQCLDERYDTASRPQLSLQGVLKLAPERQRNLLRFWLSQRLNYLPDAEGLQRIIEEVILAREDAVPELQLGGYRLSRYRDCLYLLEHPDRESEKPRFGRSGSDDSICEESDDDLLQPSLSWDLKSELSLPGGRLRAVSSVGTGLALERLGSTEIRFRQGGERLTVAGRPGGRTLKKLFQEAGIPPWQRERIPLLYSDGQLVAVCGYWIAEGFQADKEEAGLKLFWEPR